MEYANENRIAQGEAVRSLVRFKQSPEYDSLLQRELLKSTADRSNYRWSFDRCDTGSAESHGD